MMTIPFSHHTSELIWDHIIFNPQDSPVSNQTLTTLQAIPCVLTDFVNLKSEYLFIAAALESKVSNLEEQLSAEAQERMLAAKGNRKLEKKIKELMMQLEDERRHADQYKEQNEKVRSNWLSMKI